MRKKFTGIKQEKLYEFHGTRRVVRGLFYLGGRRIRRNLFSFEDAGITDIDAEGNPFFINAKVQKQFPQKVAKHYAELQATLEDEKTTSDVKADEKISTLFQIWIDSSKPRVAAHTIRNHFSRLQKDWEDLIGDLHMSMVSIRTIDHFIELLSKRGNSPVTINSKLRTLKSFLNWAHDRDFLIKVPKIKFLKEMKKIPKSLSLEQLKVLFAHIRALQEQDPVNFWNYHLHERFAMVAIGTGLRLSEIFGIRWMDVDFELREIWVRDTSKTKIKEGREKSVLMPGYLFVYLKDLRVRFPDETWLLDKGNGQHFFSSPDAIGKAFARHFATLGFDRLGVKRIHGFRAGFATILRNQLSVDARLISGILQHSDIRVTEHYFGSDKELQRSAIDRLGDLQANLLPAPPNDDVE